MAGDRVRLSVAEARELGEAALRGIGYADEDARIIADHVIDAALCGYEYSGLAKILNIPESRHFRQPRRPMAVMRETDVSIAFDGGNNVGMLALYHAARAAIDKAGARGIALVSVNDAWMSGRSAYFVEMIAKAGLVAIHTVGSSRLVAPPGGTKAALGTNPIAIAVPSSRGPIVLDMGTSAFMATEVALRERLGQLLPEGVAIGPDGEPTRDAGLARRGALLPFGGYKGFGLALMMQALGLLAGGSKDGDNDYGYLFVAFRPELLGPADAFEARVTELVDHIKATPKQKGVDEIRIPSERAFRARGRALREGLEIDRLVFDALVALREKISLSPLAGRGPG
jgi:LDH2 family malate/lactate/ureidoglycolate dehydrogenase